MLREDRSVTFLMLKNRWNDENHPMGYLPKEVAEIIIKTGYDQAPDSEIGIALSLAASGLKDSIKVLAEMVEENPRLLLQAGDVMTRGGVFSVRKTLYEFFLAEGDPEGAKQIESGFAKIPNGENERIRQYEQYRPHIEALARQVELKQSNLDLKPLIDIIKKSSAEDITAALNKNMEHVSDLSRAMCDFRNAVRPPKGKMVGMHYDHYTTLYQALDLLADERKELSSNDTNYDKCHLVWRQIIGYLMRSLPAVDRFASARAFEDAERTLNFKYDNTGSFPDCHDAGGDCVPSGLGFDEAIFGARMDVIPRRQPLAGCGVGARADSLAKTCLTKTLRLQNLCRNIQPNKRLSV